MKYEEIVVPNSISSIIFYGILAYIVSIVFSSILVPFVGPFTDIEANVKKRIIQKRKG